MSRNSDWLWAVLLLIGLGSGLLTACGADTGASTATLEMASGSNTNGNFTYTPPLYNTSPLSTKATQQAQTQTANLETNTAELTLTQPAEPATPRPTMTGSFKPCRSSDLTISTVSGSGGTGITTLFLNFINKGTTFCSLYGYPSVQLLDASGKIKAGVKLTQQTFFTGPPQMVELKPGKQAQASVSWFRCDLGQVDDGEEANIVLPNEGGQFQLAYHWPPHCQNTDYGGDSSLAISPFVAVPGN